MMVVAPSGDWLNARGEKLTPKPSDGETAEMLILLQQENQRLASQVTNLTRQVMLLELKLAESRVQLDLGIAGGGERTPVGSPKSMTVPPEVMSDPARLQVVEVNREMMVAVVSGGVRSGMKQGMRFSVVRGNDVLAVIRITDVRERIAGGLIEWNERMPFPEAGDRLVLRSTQDG
ncbi:MAG TPA: hypothetical protein PKC67_13970 [Kiritimatiellia bacterium]|nr:hypothetical protein [Kiritimatiellia bacterium]